MAATKAIRHLKPNQLAKIRSVASDPNETPEKRADANLLLKMHSSLNAKPTSATPSSDEPTAA
jgi:hypothetical protein